MAYTTINKSTDYFNTKLYTGNGGTQSITGVGFQPDWIWTKGRSGTFSAESHTLYDAVRGVTKELRSDVTNAESTNSNGVTSFDSDGFGSGAGAGINGSSTTYVAWNWKANGAGSANTDGSISSTVSANTTSGFSIVKYTGNGTAGATIGHGLGSAPKMIILKEINITGVWLTWHTGISINGQIQLQSTAAVYNPGNNIYWNSTLPTSSVFSVGTSGASNGSGTDYIAYCFADVQGFSKFGSYTGNGNADGTFVYTGFKPAFVMIKCSSSSGSYTSWSMFDTTRQTFNVNAGKTLYANKNSAEGVRGNGSDSSTTIPGIDMLSNGFKCRVLNDEVNNTADYIYMAFAEAPLVGSNNVPCTAR